MSWRRICMAMTVSVALSACTITPQSITPVDLELYTADRVDELRDSHVEVGAPITLYDALARALKYNLDYRVELNGKLAEFAKLRVSELNQLPSLVAGADYYNRDNFSGGQSRQILDSDTLGGESLTSSSSQDREIITRNVKLSWNILDFGLSRVRALQNADRVLIAEEAKRRIVNRIVEDVRTSFWRALSGQRLLGRLKRLERRVESALSNSRLQSSQFEVDPVIALRYERELLSIRRDIQGLEGSLRLAKTQLGTLMNLEPGTKFTLSHQRHHVPKLVNDYDELVQVALANRPEIRQIAYEHRINEKEFTAAMLEALPGIRITGASDASSNSLLFNNDWVSIAANVSWNLIRVLQLPTRRGLINRQEELIKVRAQALVLAIMTQVQVARAKFIHSRRELQTARQYLDVQRRLLKKLKAAYEVDRTTEQEITREEMNTLAAEVRYDIAYAEMQNAYANIYASIGVDLLTTREHDELSLSELSAHISRAWKEREAGQLQSAPSESHDIVTGSVAKHAFVTAPTRRPDRANADRRALSLAVRTPVTATANQDRTANHSR
ncbi:MAG: TolC family protein [Ahrensia sp.]|nr:TolC family protein [Ahrensia sp.]